VSGVEPSIVAAWRGLWLEAEQNLKAEVFPSFQNSPSSLHFDFFTFKIGTHLAAQEFSACWEYRLSTEDMTAYNITWVS
jgi:hypothetical protein